MERLPPWARARRKCAFGARMPRSYIDAAVFRLRKRNAPVSATCQ